MFLHILIYHFSTDLPLRSSSDVHSCLTVPQDGQILIKEMDHSVVSSFPQFKLTPTTHHSGRTLRQNKDSKLSEAGFCRFEL